MIIIIISAIIAIILLGILIWIGTRDLEVEDLYGSWNGYKLEAYKDNKSEETLDKTGYLIQIFDKTKLKLCYTKDTVVKCEEVGYSYNDNYINIDENNLYMSGKFKVDVKSNILMITDVLSDDYKTVFYFYKEGTLPKE